jgi:hypothetical protein
MYGFVAMLRGVISQVGAIAIGAVFLVIGTAPAMALKQASARANARGALRLRLGDAELVAPVGALPSHAQVTVRRSPSAFGSASRSTFVFTVSHGQLERASTLRLPLAPGAAPRSLVALAYRDSRGTWYTVPARVNSSGTVATARITHLSTWAGIDIETYVISRLEQALEPHANAASADTCTNADPLVAVSGAGPLQVCVSNPSGSRSQEEVTLSNPTYTAFVVGPCTGGLASRCVAYTLKDSYSGVLAPDQQYVIPYDALQTASTVRFTPSDGYTVETRVVPALGGLFDDVPGFVVGVGACVLRHNPARLSLPAGVAVAIGCIFEAGFGALKLGALDIGALRSAEASVLRSAATTAIQKQTLAPGGTITLTSQQQLPGVGGTDGSAPVSPTPPSAPAPAPAPSYYVYYVTGTCADGACGLHIREGPGYSDYRAIGSLNEGAEVQIVCQAEGATVGPSPSKGTSSSIWDQLVGGGWVSDLYITTPNTGTWSPPIPQC